METALNRGLSQEDHRNNNVFPDAEPGSDEDSPVSLGSLVLTEGYLEDTLPELTMLQQEYVDPSLEYEFVHDESQWPSNLDNSEALMQQLTALGVRVPNHYLTLDLDASNSRTASVSSSEGGSWHEEEDDVSFASPAELEDEVVQAEILPNGGVKVSYDNLQKNYSARISSQNNFHDYLRIVQSSEEDKQFPAEGEAPLPAAAAQAEPAARGSRKLSRKMDVGLLRRKLATSFAQLKKSNLNLQAKCASHIRRFKAEEITYDAMTPDSGIHDNFSALTPEEQEKQREEWNTDLAKTEDEIQTLRQVLASKVKHAQDLKRRLGITVWREFSEDISSSLRSVKESQTVQKANEVIGDFTDAVTGAPLVLKANDAFSEFHGAVTTAPLYQKTAGAMSAVGEKTGAIFGGIGARFGQLKETPTFKSFEERVGSVYTTAKVNLQSSVNYVMN